MSMSQYLIGHIIHVLELQGQPNIFPGVLNLGYTQPGENNWVAG